MVLVLYQISQKRSKIYIYIFKFWCQNVDLLETGIDLETAWDPKLKNLASNKNVQVRKFETTESFSDSKMST